MSSGRGQSVSIYLNAELAEALRRVRCKRSGRGEDTRLWRTTEPTTTHLIIEAIMALAVDELTPDEIRKIAKGRQHHSKTHSLLEYAKTHMPRRNVFDDDD